MPLFLDNLLEVAIKEIIDVLKELDSKYTEDNFYAFSLSTDSDVTSVYPSACSEQFLDKISGDEQTKIGYKWSPDEWPSRFPDGEKFDNTNKILSNSCYPDGNESEEGFFERKIEKVFALSLAMCEARKKFGDRFNDTLFYLNFNDAEDYEIEIMLDAAKEYNSGKILDEFIAFFRPSSSD